MKEFTKETLITAPDDKNIVVVRPPRAARSLPEFVKTMPEGPVDEGSLASLFINCTKEEEWPGDDAIARNFPACVVCGEFITKMQEAGVNFPHQIVDVWSKNRVLSS